ncbi:TetR family transcriptional regulator [Kibdelosporangium lantanae]
MSGLRERKKQATREALSLAALRLAVERGIDNVLVEDIAAAAEVSPRTFNNYFSSKFEAIAWREIDRATRIGDVIRDRPADEPLWDVIETAVMTVYGGAAADQATATPPPGWAEGVRAFIDHPQMFGEILKGRAQVVDVLAASIAARLGLDHTRDMYPNVLAGSVMAAWQTAQQFWLRSDPPRPMGELVRAALNEVKDLQGGMS